MGDETPATGMSPAEFQAVTAAVISFARQRTFTYFEIPEDADAYKVVFVALLPLLERLALDERKVLVFASTQGIMEAGARNALGRLLVFCELLQFLTWGDLMLFFRDRPQMMQNAIIIGDLDFHADPAYGQSVTSSDGSARRDDICGFVRNLARGRSVKTFAFHRIGRLSPFGIKSDSETSTEQPAKTKGFFARLWGAKE